MLWPGARAMCRFLTSNAASLRSCRVIELGAGCAAASAVAARSLNDLLTCRCWTPWSLNGWSLT